MYENVYGAGRPLVGRRRSYCVDAHCRVSKSIYASSPEEAEQVFYEDMGHVEDRMPEMVFEILQIQEEEDECR